MEERTPLSLLVGKTIASINFDDAGYIRFIDADGNCFALINEDNMFDADGNYHVNDLGYGEVK